MKFSVKKNMTLRNFFLPVHHLISSSSVLLSFLFFFTKGLECIRLEAVLVPQFRFRGQNAALLCKYKLEPNEELFSLKWYKRHKGEDVEFYRYTPPDPSPSSQYGYGYGNQQYKRKRSSGNQHYYSSSPDGKWNIDDLENNGRIDRKNKASSGGTWYSSNSQHHRVSVSDYNEYDSGGQDETPAASESLPGEVLTWKVPGIKIDERQSLPQEVVLKKVTFKSSGTYRCEVTATVRQNSHGYPGIQAYRMKESTHRMTVIELPGRDPRINGDDWNREYAPGDLLNLTCESAPSNPPADLEWSINGKLVDSDFIADQRLEQVGRDLYSSKIGLMMPLESRHFSDTGELSVKCRGTIRAEFWENNDEKTFTDYENSKKVKVLQVKDSQWPASSSEALRPSSFAVILFLLFLFILVTMASTPKHMATFH